MLKYLLCVPRGGFNDCLSELLLMINYCNRYNRIVLFDMKYSCYNINFADYFIFKHKRVIIDSNIIKKILNKEMTIYPKLENISNALLNENKWVGKIIYLPKGDRPERLIITSFNMGMNGFRLFKQLRLKKNLINYCLKNNISDKYLFIHVRNTDYKSNYKKTFKKYKNLIKSYKKIYLATDDKQCLSYLKSKQLPVYNFTTFPEGEYHNLHYSKIDPDIKIKNLILDLYLATKSDELISDSQGLFVKLLKKCRKYRHIILPKFKI